jgi:hypothetical protein
VAELQAMNRAQNAADNRRPKRRVK